MSLPANSIICHFLVLILFQGSPKTIHNFNELGTQHIVYLQLRFITVKEYMGGSARGKDKVCSLLLLKRHIRCAPFLAMKVCISMCAIFLPREASQKLITQGFCWWVVIQVPYVQQLSKFQITRGKSMFSINHILQLRHSELPLLVREWRQQCQVLRPCPRASLVSQCVYLSIHQTQRTLLQIPEVFFC